MTITPDRGTNISIRSLQVKGCQVCSGSGRQRRCDSSLLLKDASGATAVEFTCSAPQEQFSVEVTRNIGTVHGCWVGFVLTLNLAVLSCRSLVLECSVKSCSGNVVQADSGSLPLLAFHRTFTWTLQATAPTALRLDFGRIEGLRQVNGSAGCPDHHSYSLLVSEGKEDVVVGSFCRHGPISSAQILNRGRFSLEVPGKRRLQGGQVVASVGQEIKCKRGRRQLIRFLPVLTFT